jgi:hypothetical protein
MEASHHDAVMRLWRENLAALQSADKLERRFRWMYQGNPAGPAGTIVCVHVPTSEVVGCASLLPRRLRMDGQEIVAGMPVDFAVSKGHRSGAAAVRLQRSLVSGAALPCDFLYGFPNKAALAVLQRGGFKAFAPASGWVKPLRAAYKLEPVLRSKFAAHLAALPADLWLAARDSARPHVPVGDSFFVGRADDRFDALWEETRDRYTIVGERSSAYLNWRYAEFTTLPYQFFAVNKPGSQNLLGYIAFTVRGRTAVVGDLFCTDMGPGATALLLQFAIALRRSTDLQSIFLGFVGGDRFKDVLKRVGFIARPMQARMLVGAAVSLTPDQTTRAFDSQHWHLCDGELDI